MAPGTENTRNPQSLPALAQHRRRNGVTLEQIAESTKISIRFLRHIESEEFHKLPGGIFARSYIRQYACAIGFDEEELLERYHRQGGGKEPARRPRANDSGSEEKSWKRASKDWFRKLSPIRFL